MNKEETDNIEVYALVGVVAIIVFFGYDGFFYEGIRPNEIGGSWKSKLGGLLRWSIWKIGEDYIWINVFFRGMFLIVALWMGYKIYKTRYQKKK
ncbi:hypothetical protein HX109_05935 [Galbibacter sp. BG1]|uniref:hypothetical protein n=1 Tax=Galbibacter sp. BG1 TaxID=1170699 RepID=UPI0015C05C93|nr:hypothetical protein [Galbibacter sp. BG1]QLE01126.1 hypothetical protein HX109_05935 [Galbibacter sp. BG1]